MKAALINRRRRWGRSAAAAAAPPNTPPIRLPPANAASAMPPSERPPCSSANAGIDTSAAPNAIPHAPLKRSTRRTPQGVSASSRRWEERSWLASTRRARTAGVKANPIVPTQPAIAAAATPALDDTVVVSAATTSGPATKSTSCSVASRANAVVRSSGRGSIDGHIIRMVGLMGGATSPATIAAAMRTGSGASRRASRYRPVRAMPKTIP